MNKDDIKTLYNLNVLPWIYLTKDKIENHGIALPEEYKKIAKLAGVENIEKIKVLYSDEIEISFEELLNLKNQTIAQLNGFALGYHIFINTKAPASTLVHELRHVAQFELFDSLNLFVQTYINEFIKFGYKQGPFEKDAIDFANSVSLQSR